MRRSRTIAIAACAALLSLLLAATAPAKFRGAPNSDLQRSLEAIVDSKGGPPGISVLIDRGPHKEYFGAGVADARSGQVPTPFQHFRIASVAKGFNSYLAIKLAEGGTLTLEDRLRDWIPGVLPEAEPVKLRELLQHTSGLAEYIEAPEFVKRFTADLSGYFSPIELTGFVRDDPLEFAPGSQYHYSDTDNIAAGLIEEEASGLPYDTLLQRRVFGPLKMPGSSLPTTVKMPRPLMRGYEVEPNGKLEDVSELINPAGAWASGGIVSTPIDLSRFVARYVPTVLGATKDIEGGPFRPGSSSPPGPGKNFAGLGIFQYRAGCGTVFGHTGSFPGYRILIAASRDGKRSVVFVVNSQIVPRQGPSKVAKAITEAQAKAICRALG